MIVSSKLALTVLNEALKTGADFAEIFAEDTVKHGIDLSHKKVDQCIFNNIYGVGIRLKKDGKQVYGYTSEVSKNSLVKLANDLASSFEGTQKITVSEFKSVRNPKKHQPAKKYDTMTDEQLIAYLKRAEKAMYDVSPLIVNAYSSIEEKEQHVEIYNSNGRYVTDTRTRTRLFFNAVAARDGLFQSDSEFPGGSVGLELLDEYVPEEIGKKVAENAVALLDADECPSGKMDVIIGNKFGGVLFHEACGHPLEGTAISHNTSPFAGKLGQKIASDVVSAMDDGTIPNAWGSENFDDEGEVATANMLIKDGVLVNYMVDNYDGERMGMKSTGACRRESFRYLPTTRMTNTFICAGKSTVDEIIKNTKNGLYCVSFAGGSVDPATDKFNFTASMAYLVKDGKIGKMVRDAAIIGYGYEVLMNIDMVADDLARGQGMCGAASGSVEADVGQPTLRVKNITVGGRGANV